MFGGPWDSTLIMMDVQSLKMGVPSFNISFEFWKVVHPSMKGFEQPLAVQTGVAKHLSTICIDSNFDLFFGWFLRWFGLN